MNMQKKLRISRIVTIVFSAVIIVLFFLPLVRVNDNNVSVIEFVFRSIRSGGVADYVGLTKEDLQYGVDSNLKVVFLFMTGYAFMPILYLVYLIGRFLNKELYRYELTIHLVHTFFAMTLFIMAMGTPVIVWHPFVVIVITMFEFVGRKLIEDTSGDSENMEKRDEPAVNNPMLYKVIWKNWSANKKNFIIFFSGSVITVMLTFISVASAGMLMRMHTVLKPSMVGGIMDIVKMAVIIIAVVNLFLTGFSVKFYVRSRMKDYGLFLILGIRERTMEILVIIEYISSLAAALILGCLIGLPGSTGVRYLLNKYGPSGITLGETDVWICAISIGISILIFIIAFFMNKEEILGLALSGTMTAEAAAERQPMKRRKLWLTAGFAITVVVLVMYTQRIYFESLYMLFAFSVGIYLIYYYGGSYLADRLKHIRKWYYKNILTVNNFYHRYKSSSTHIFSMFMLDFFIIAYLMVNVISAASDKPAKSHYPYDFVCMFETLDEPFFEELGTEYDAQVKIEPMTRITVPDITPKRENPALTMEIPQGQQIAISESTYNRLNPGKIDLDGNEIFISYQQTKSENAHPADFTNLSKVPAMHAGLPLSYEYTQRSQLFDQNYKLTGEERNVFLGHLQSGYQENVIVFSDDNFRKFQENADGPQYMALINTSENTRKEVGEKLTQYVDAHVTKTPDSNPFGYRYDSKIKGVYDTNINLKDEQSETLLKIIVNILSLCSLIFATWFIQFIKYASDSGPIRRKSEFLTCLGMRQKEIKKTIAGEIYLTRALSFVPAFILGIIFTGIILAVRLCDTGEVLAYIQIFAPALLVYILIQIIVTTLINRYATTLYR